jgi:putative addiction module component (TIGR02574 family)
MGANEMANDWPSERFPQFEAAHRRLTELPAVELSEEQKQELRRRAAEHEANPEDAIPWEQVKAEALARFRK